MLNEIKEKFFTGELNINQFIDEVVAHSCSKSDAPDLPLIGKNVYVKQVTYHYLGKLVAVTKDFFVLESVAWVADSGRLHKFLSEGIWSDGSSSPEIEMYPQKMKVYLSRAASVEICEWVHALPTTSQ